MLRIEKTPVFDKHARGRLDDESLDDLEKTLTANPAAGKVMPGTGGLRKLRIAAPGRGKRGGFRVVILLGFTQRPDSPARALPQK